MTQLQRSPNANSAPPETNPQDLLGQMPISVEVADALIGKAVRLAGVERVAFPRATGRILRQSVAADRPFPPFDRVAMDGIAVSRADWEAGAREFVTRGIAPAGAPRMSLEESGTCIRVMTGAVMPVGADLVVPVEGLVEELVEDSQSTRIVAGPDARAAQHVHRKGSDRREGEELLSPGVRIAASHVAVLATVGESSVAVSKRPKITIVATGDELVSVDDTPLPHQIRGSNAPAIAAELEAAGFPVEALLHCQDDREELERTLGDAIAASDVMILSGGVSAGDYDYVPAVLKELGVTTILHKVTQRPGKPLWFGRADSKSESGSRPVVFGLPGNPVSALVATARYVAPFLIRCSASSDAERETFAILSQSHRFDKPLTLFLPVTLQSASDGTLTAHPVPTNGSGDLAGLAEAEALMELPKGQNEFPAGFVGRLFRFGAAR